MHVDATIVIQQTSSQEAQARADAAAQLRQAVEQARQQQAQAREQAREAQAQAREAQAQAREAARDAMRAQQDAAREQARAMAQGGLPVPPAPERIVVQDGHVVVTTDGGGFNAGTLQHGGMPDVPPTAANIAYMFFVTLAVIAIGIPLARAFGRWLDRRGAPAPALPADLTARLERIEQAVETVAVEVERISEGQRFTSRLMSEMRQAPAPALPQLEGTRFPEPRR